MNAPFNPRGSATREPFAAFVTDEATADLLKPVVSELGWPQERINKGGLRNAVQSLSVSASPHILFVDLSESGRSAQRHPRASPRSASRGRS